MKLKAVVLLLCVWMTLAGAAFGAGASGTLHGFVSDTTGGVLPNATITITLQERGASRVVYTDDAGAYVATLLPIGTYAVRVEAPGFKAFEREGLTLTSTQNVRVDAQLEVGPVTESITVLAEAPQVDSRSATMGTLIDSRRVLDLPLDGRNVVGLAELLPGAARVDAPQTFTRDRDGPTVAMSGSRPNQNLLLFDGVHYNAVFRNTGLNYAPPDAIQEVKVLTSNFGADYGRNGGSVFQVVTKSGSNELHGSVWEFLRNDNLNARNFFADETPNLIQNQFGAAVGGPLRRDKLFFFGSYEGLRIRPESLSTSAFPLTAAERAGDFSAARPLRDPDNGQPFDNNQIPVSRFDTVSANILSRNLIPLPNRADGQYVALFPEPRDNDTFLGRVDYNAGMHTLSGRYNYAFARENESAGQIPDYMQLDREAVTQNVALSDSYVIRHNMINELRAGFTRVGSSAFTANPYHISDLGGEFPLFGPKIPPLLGVVGRLTAGSSTSGDATIVNQAWNISDNINWVANGHTIKAGAELLKLRYLNRSAFMTQGAFPFTGEISGDSAADFVLGRMPWMQVASPLLEQAGSQMNSYYFVQDDWRIHPRLTLNLGLRYELPLTWVHPNDFWGTLRPGQSSQVIPNAPTGMVFPGDAGIARGLVATDKNNVAPRFGFAWDPFGHGRTAVRGGYGIFYDSINADVIQNSSQPYRYSFTFGAPVSLTQPLLGQPEIPLTVDLSNPQFVGTQELFYPDATLRTPYVQHFNFNVQQEVARDLVVQVGYMGKIGRKLLMGLAANPAVYGPGASSGNIDSRRLLRGFGNNTVISSLANSRYNALQVEATKRFSQNFSFQMAYTFSRSIDMESSIGVGGGTPNVFDLSTQFGLSDFHAKHIGSFSWLWDLPRLRSHSTWLRALAGGWQLNGLVTMRTGFPVNVVSGRDVALSGTLGQRVNVIGEHRLEGDRSTGEKVLAWFDPGAFARPANGAYGDAGRNALIGPGGSAANLALFKNFDLRGERTKLQFRSEFFNAFNHVNLGRPNGTQGSRMGRITTAGDARVIQLAMKLLF
jgi:outer membrane receptor protein involved in Fe transport